jgi:hypothetical protein
MLKGFRRRCITAMIPRYTFVRRLVRIWTDFNEKPSWKYPELAPTPLLRSLKLNHSEVDSSELNRAKWFWQRRPRLILGEGFFGWALVCLPAIILFSLQISFVWRAILSPVVGLGLPLAWFLAAYLVIVMDTARLVRWRREYEVSVHRLTRTRHETS